jgi:hypothetical protein
LSRATAFALEGLAATTLLEGDPRATARLLGAAATLRDAPGAAVGLAFAAIARLDAESLLAAARDSLGAEAVTQAFAEGRRDPVSALAGVALATS